MIEFISGLMTGGLFGILLMCLLQIYRDNELQRRINKAIEYIKQNLQFCKNDSQGAYDVCNIRIASDKKLLKILGGDVDDE